MIYLQKAKEMVAAGILGPEGHAMSRPEEVGISNPFKRDNV